MADKDYGTYVQYTGDGSTTTYPVSFPIDEVGDIVATVDGVAEGFTYNSGSGSITFAVAPGVGTDIVIRREVDVAAAPHVFTDKNVLRNNNLDANFDKLFKSSQDAQDRLDALDDEVISYNDLVDVPTEFPPAAHTHTESDIVDLDKYSQAAIDAQQAAQDARLDALEAVPPGSTAWEDVTGKPTEFPPEAHTHVEADITDLQDYLLDAPSDGQQYAREDGAWAVVTGGGGGATAIDDLTDVDTSTTPPAVDEALIWDGTNWVPGEVAAGGGGAASASQANSMILLDTVVWDGDTEKVIGVPPGYSEIFIEAEMRGTRAAATENLAVYLNGDETEANYWTQWNSGQAGAGNFGEVANPRFAFIPGATAPANEYGYWSLSLQDYENTDALRKMGAYYKLRYGSGDAAVGTRTTHHDTMTAATTSIKIESLNAASNGTMKVWGRRDITIEDSDTILTRKEVPVVLTGGVFSIDLTGYQDGDTLVIEGEIRDSVAGTNGLADIEINGDTTAANYHRQNSGGSNGTSNTSEASDNLLAAISASGSEAGFFSPISATISNYTGTNLKVVDCHYVGYDRGAMITGRHGVLSSITDAITSVDIRSRAGSLSGTLRAYIEKQGVIALTGSERQSATKLLLDTKPANADGFLEFTVPSGYTNVWFEGEIVTNNASSQDELNMFLNGDLNDASYQGAIIMGSGSANGQTRAHPFCSFVQGATAYNDPSPFEVKLQKYDRTAYHAWTSRYYTPRESGAMYVGGGGCSTKTQFGPVRTARFSPEYGSTMTGEIRMYGERDITLEDSETVLTTVEVPVTLTGGEFDIDLSGHQDAINVYLEGFVASSSSSGLNDALRIVFNEDTSATNYDRQNLSATNAAINVAEGNENQTVISANSVTLSNPAWMRIDVPGFADSNLKMALGEFNIHIQNGQIWHGKASTGHRTMTAPITRLRLRTDNFPTDTLSGSLRCYVEKQGVVATTPVPSGKVELQTIELTTAGQFDFDNIPGTHRRLIVQGTVRANGAEDYVDVHINGDTTGTNYNSTILQTYNGTTSSSQFNDPSAFYVGNYAAGYLEATIDDYANSGSPALVSTSSRARVASGNLVIHEGAVDTTANAAVTRVTISHPNSLLGTLTLYGED